MIVVEIMWSCDDFDHVNIVIMWWQFYDYHQNIVNGVGWVFSQPGCVQDVHLFPTLENEIIPLFIIHVQDLTNHVARFGRNTHAAILHLGILLKFSVVIFEVMLEVVIFVKQRRRWDHQACQNIFLARIFYMTEYWPILSLNGRDHLNHKFEESDKVVRSREYEDGDDE